MAGGCSLGSSGRGVSLHSFGASSFGASLQRLKTGKPHVYTVEAHLFIYPTLELLVIYETTVLPECRLNWAARSLSVPPTAEPAGRLLARLLPFSHAVSTCESSINECYLVVIVWWFVPHSRLAQTPCLCPNHLMKFCAFRRNFPNQDRHHRLRRVLVGLRNATVPQTQVLRASTTRPSMTLSQKARLGDHWGT